MARPTLLFKNPNSAGANIIKFDKVEENELVDGIELVVSHSRLALWCEAEGPTSIAHAHCRSAANPGYAVLVLRFLSSPML